MADEKISQGPWTRIRPLQRNELDPYTEAGMVEGELTWGRFRNNLCKVMAYCPGLMQTEVAYCNKFIFDPPTFRGDVQEAGFNDRFIKEMVIIRISLMNRSWYSITHHSFIGMALFTGADRRDEGHQKYLHMHEYEKHPDVYTERERTILDYAGKVTQDAHLVTDEEFEQLKTVFADHNAETEPRWKKMSKEQKDRHVDAQIVELTWLIGHFGLLNLWFTVLQVPDETEKDEDNFLAAYAEMVPEDVRQRNDEILQGDS